MWEQILIAVIIELIKRRLSEDSQREFEGVSIDGRKPENVLREALKQPLLRHVIIGVFADIAEDIFVNFGVSGDRNE